MKVIQSVSKDEIKKAADEYILKGSIVLIDGHSSYKQLSKNYKHTSKNYYEADNTEFLKWLHIIIGNAKT